MSALFSLGDSKYLYHMLPDISMYDFFHTTDTFSGQKTMLLFMSWGEEREISVEKWKVNGEGANAKTDLIGCGENAAPESV